VGARLDEQPELLFRLRGVDPAQLIAKSVGRAAAKTSQRAAKRTVAPEALSSIFGIEIDDAPRNAPRAATASATTKATAKTTTARRKATALASATPAATSSRGRPRRS
jgi:uncharacterized Zn finger protein